MRRVALVVTIVVVALVALLGVRLWVQARARNAPPGGSGEIEGTTVDVSARITARVLKQVAVKGRPVKAGDLLVELDCSDQDALLAESEARLAAARATATAASANVDASRRSQDAATAAEAAAKAQAAALAAQRDVAKREAARLEALPEDVSLSTRDRARGSAEQLAAQTAAAEAQARASAQQAQVATVAIEASGAQATSSRASAKAAEETARRNRLLAEECVVRAPRDAMLDDLPHEVGELVPAGQPLARLVDISEVKAIFYLPNAEIGAVRPGGKAAVVADAFPDRKFEGRVASVSSKAEFTPRNIQTRSDRDRLVYPVEVRVPNPDGLLRPGMPVQVTLSKGD
ncbi:MAG TPA: HlyD family efflux transporter periplasmic adaptor subunit [Anaeromyxobacteraceae bacterium]|nr:HlyD family efflux transporter periplasmic adaptor subunit [Anaeromyxobacteraceae bacterium]